MRSLPHHEIGVVGERGSEGFGIACVPGVDHPLMNGTNALLVGDELSCWL